MYSEAATRRRCLSSLESVLDNYAIKIIDGQLPDGQIGQWFEASFDSIRPKSFGFSATFCRRKDHEDFCQYSFGATVPAAFNASLAFALLRFASQPPLAPSKPRAMLVLPHAKVVPSDALEELEAMLTEGEEPGCPIPAQVIERLAQGRSQITWYMRMAASGAFR